MADVLTDIKPKVRSRTESSRSRNRSQNRKSADYRVRFSHPQTQFPGRRAGGNPVLVRVEDRHGRHGGDAFAAELRQLCAIGRVDVHEPGASQGKDGEIEDWAVGIRGGG